jgi:hypothetical protein
MGDLINIIDSIKITLRDSTMEEGNRIIKINTITKDNSSNTNHIISIIFFIIN